jgi:pyridoxine 5-phosphate synthase
VFELAELLQAWPQREYNIEGNPFHNLLEVARELRARGLPLHQLTFVPDSVGQYTSDHGWSLPADAERLRPVIAQAQALGARVSLFMDAEPEQMAAARALGADRVELYTEPYAAAHTAAYTAAHTAAYAAAAGPTSNAADAAAGTHCPPCSSAATPNATASAALRAQLQRYAATAQAALDAGLGVNAGHDLNRANLSDFLRQVPGVREVSIGHALIADALDLGYSATVRAYLRCIEEAAATQASPAAPATHRP